METKDKKVKNKIPALSTIVTKIRRALKSQGTYTEDLEIAIATTAGAYRAFLVAQEDVVSLDKTYYETMSREGNIKYVSHPAIKTMKDTQSMVLEGLKNLGLTLNTLTTGGDDPIADLEEKMRRI